VLAAGPGAVLAAALASLSVARVEARAAVPGAATKQSNHDLCTRLQGFVGSVVVPSPPLGTGEDQAREVSSFDPSPGSERRSLSKGSSGIRGPS